ncbi:VacJ family lipoprotein [Starkeya koreensis]|uniref:VacJ family lipoprotein n=1 Tax=Ancylobacter koreensis TaxID=266121 RepID=A0ABT0DQH0_9HYPH|nr:VacJ family lipoprotein [Ancylobacter koreensis]MCK0209434.1 VacJ family lipoprotein [Ancylobacter koreensis]
MIRACKTFLPLAFAGAVLLSAPASAQTAATSAAWDPLETLNRATYAFNVAFVAVVAEPVISAYRSSVPASVQTGIDNVFTNLREPLTAISSGVQGDMNNLGLSVGRFAINTTAGIGGIFDVATRLGWVSRAEDLGTAFCSYGVPTGPYLVLPFVGPTTAREAAGTVVTYGITYGAAHDYTLGYVVADRVVAAASDLPLTQVTVTPTEAPAATPAPATETATTVTAPSYEASRDEYLAFRQQLCTDSIPAADLKPSPLGGVIRVN